MKSVPISPMEPQQNWSTGLVKLKVNNVCSDKPLRGSIPGDKPSSVRLQQLQEHAQNGTEGLVECNDGYDMEGR